MNRNQIYIKYLKYFWIPGYVLKSATVLAIFNWPLFSYVQLPGDYFVEIYYLMLYSCFLIPFYDFPIITILSFRNFKEKSLMNFVNSICIGLIVSFCVGVLTLLSGIVFGLMANSLGASDIPG